MSTQLSALLTMTVLINTSCYNSRGEISPIDECSCSKDTLEQAFCSFSDDDIGNDQKLATIDSKTIEVGEKMQTRQAVEPYCIEDLTLGDEQENKRESYYHEGWSLSSIVEEYKNKNFSERFQKKIIIEKSRRVLGVYGNGVLLKEYGVSLGEQPAGDKEREGDRKTPEGEFYIAEKKKFTVYHNAFLLSYPNLENAKRGLASGLINRREYEAIETAINQCKIPPQNTGLGGDIEFHGGGGIKEGDWTWGCAALEDREVDELASFVEVGCTKDGTYKTKVIIRP